MHFVYASYIASTYLLAMAFPYFGALLGFFGGFAFAPTTYFVSMQIYVLTMNDVIKLQPSYVGEMCAY